MTEPGRNAWPKAGAGGRSRADLAWTRALAHPVRVEILRTLVEQEPGTPSGFAATLEIPLGVASHHVRRLRDLRLIGIVRRTYRRGAVQHHYRLTDRVATTQALWRWGVAPDGAAPADARSGPGGTTGRETMQRVIGELRRLREQQGMSQTTLAERAGITRDHLGRVERGEADPRMSVLLALGLELGASLRDVFAAAEGARVPSG
ncbi:MAG TPA: helix-turn-helix domain-containing protein [Conexibacter sp.]|jgi:DNA-binding XRE family transcriptional regulator|nr:helix-turn-helix domain-containing protein [Conexibacter sp.]